MSEAQKTIFLVDDEVVNLAVGKNALSDFYSVFTLDSGETMLELLGKVLPDLILLDVNMPGMNGYEAIKRLKANDDTADIPVIFLTGLNDEEEELTGLTLGAVDYITKPFLPTLLRKRIEIHLLMESQRRQLLFFSSLLVAEIAALDRLSRMKTEFLGNLSHELKTPLTVVLGDLQRIGREIRKCGFENERVLESLERAGGEVKRMARLTDSAIKMATQTDYHSEMEVVDTTRLFTLGIEGYRAIAERQGNRLVLEMDDHLPPIYGNTDQLLSVLSNLLTNANKHTINGEITVTVEDKLTHVSVCVRDNGAGIARDMLQRVFERGMSGSGSTGMGLSICKSIVLSHGGDISIDSEVGYGTAVTFTVAAYNKEG